jgi:hypothetical protein
MAERVAQASLRKIAQQYRKEGYDVATSPDKRELGDLSDSGIDLLARRGKEVVAVRVLSRGDIYDIQEIETLTRRVQSRRGWRFDVVVVSPDDDAEIPRNGSALGQSEIRSLAAEARTGLRAGTLRSSFLIAWTAFEAAMRDVAGREGIPVDRDSPQLLTKTLYSNGLMSKKDYLLVKQSLQMRNALVHGFEPHAFGASDVEFVLNLAERLTKAAA